ncbi:autophagy protein Apg6 (macronuclear) [Tetrahymena thermophila SB210]|uniref:Autophagy protein Apg6 n=1 Tax=Tetrahymena thermophila (strain SB210) TaxID=312017 RepID=I7M3N4_TETTS|nr:autophagy protein Apg6 [Tetrahymena thermophila SB210]EAS03790.2 autophagy protein Apg6 [Tetrahymena thermophila SB210]|eukprot:XP_001024035.2 autophagy protein Apg6 [Tetrahymena thermophila SB210]
MSIPPPTLNLVQKSRSQNQIDQNGMNQANVYNCIFCEEEYVESGESQEIDKEFSQIEGIDGIDLKDYRLCHDCVQKKIQELQNSLSNNVQEIGRLQEQELYINELVGQSQSKFTQEDFKLLGEREQDLNLKIKISEVEKEKLRVQVVKLQDEYCKVLKEENMLDDEILQLEKEILDLNEQKQMQQKELLQVNQQIKSLENQDFLRDQFRIDCNKIMINGFTLTLPTKDNYTEFNQGMGQLCLLFEFLKGQTEYAYQNIKLFECNGAVSKVKRSLDMSLDLYCKLSDQDTPHSKGSSQRFHIPFEGLREFSAELILFFEFIFSKYSKNMKKENLEKIRKDDFDRSIGELQNKKQIKENWDLYFSQILHHFDCILDACQQFI